MVVYIRRDQINNDVLQECVVNCSCPHTPLTDGVGHKVNSTFHKSLMTHPLSLGQWIHGHSVVNCQQSHK